MLRPKRQNAPRFSVFYQRVAKQGRAGQRRRGRRQMPASKKKPAARSKKKPARRTTPHFAFPVLEQRQLDLIGLALVGLGLFFAFLVYFGWDGGRAGSQAVEGLRWLLGAGHYLLPVGPFPAGGVPLPRPAAPP